MNLVFFRIGWMSRYDGLDEDDSIRGGGAYVSENGFGHEILNFRPFEGFCYGYVQPPRGRKKRYEDAAINIGRLGAAKSADYIEGITIIWIARRPEGGMSVVGAYRDATIYRKWQEPLAGSGRVHEGESIGFYTHCREADAHLIESDQRHLSIPRRGDGGPGQANIWYGGDEAGHRWWCDLELWLGSIRETSDKSTTEPESSKRATRVLQAIVRDPMLAYAIKSRAGNICQNCKRPLPIANGKLYCEAHHVRPLGRPHNGPDELENMICLCPNCHKQFDYGMIEMKGESFSEVASAHLDYHNRKIFGRD